MMQKFRMRDASGMGVYVKPRQKKQAVTVRYNSHFRQGVPREMVLAALQPPSQPPCSETAKHDPDWTGAPSGARQRIVASQVRARIV